MLHNFFCERWTKTINFVIECFPNNISIICEKVNYIWELSYTFDHSHDGPYFGLLKAVDIIYGNKKAVRTITQMGSQGIVAGLQGGLAQGVVHQGGHGGFRHITSET